MIDWLPRTLTAEQGELIGPLATLTAATIASIVALMALRTSAAVNLRNKRVDVIIDCNKRYDSLAQTRTDIIKSIADLQASDQSTKEPEFTRASIGHGIDLYHRRFWGLKSDQIDYWLAGYVDPETLISWFMSTIDTVQSPVELWRDFVQTAEGGWPSVRNFHEITNPRLYQIVELLSAEKIGRLEPEEKYAFLFTLFCQIEREERSLIAMLKRNSHRRLTMNRFRSKLPTRVNRHVARNELAALSASFIDPTTSGVGSDDSIASKGELVM